MTLKESGFYLSKSNRLVMFLLIVILSSCGSNLPSEKMAKEELNNNPKSPFEYSDYRKTNGIKGNLGGQEMYEMKFHAKLLAKDSLYTYSESRGDTLYVMKTNTKVLNSIERTNAWHVSNMKRIRGYKKGEYIKDVDGSVSFLKTENGWEIMR